LDIDGCDVFIELFTAQAVLDSGLELLLADTTNVQLTETRTVYHKRPRAVA
jgi:hypothetical protein